MNVLYLYLCCSSAFQYCFHPWVFWCSRKPDISLPFQLLFYSFSLLAPFLTFWHKNHAVKFKQKIARLHGVTILTNVITSPANVWFAVKSAELGAGRGISSAKSSTGATVHRTVCHCGPRTSPSITDSVRATAWFSHHTTSQNQQQEAYRIRPGLDVSMKTAWNRCLHRAVCTVNHPIDVFTSTIFVSSSSSLALFAPDSAGISIRISITIESAV